MAYLEDDVALIAASCAQRLAASEVMAYVIKQTICIVVGWCSTPCGIRGYGIHIITSRTLSHFVVLNALRHQRLWHLSYCGGVYCCTAVLNALRHQRLWHLPSGGLWHSAHVLNALRHQRLWHDSTQQAQ